MSDMSHEKAGDLGRSRPAREDAARRCAEWTLRLLLAKGAPSIGADHVDWPLLLHIARDNSVLLRVSERLAACGIVVPRFFSDAVEAEEQRVRSMLDLVSHVSGSCESHGVPFVLPKAFQDYPDMGDDIDLLISGGAAERGDVAVAGLRSTIPQRDFGQRLANAVSYEIAGHAAPLDVQRGRLGVVGEHRAFAAMLISRRRLVSVSGRQFYTAAPEEQLVLQGLQRVFGRLRIAACDVVFTALTIRDGSLAWDRIFATASRYGAFLGLSCYLHYVDRVYQDAMREPLLPSEIRQSLSLRGWGDIEFRDGGYRFPVLRVNARLYGAQWAQRVIRGDWRGAARLCLIPLVGGDRLLRRMTRGPRNGMSMGERSATVSTDIPSRGTSREHLPVSDGT